jgi:flagellar biosynthesis anti-sigma factor FlgM
MAQVTRKGITKSPKNNPGVHSMWSFRLLSSVVGAPFLMTRGPDRPTSRAPSGSEEPTPTAKIQALLDQIRGLDKSMNEARRNKIENIKRAIADGTYHVSAAEVARKILDNMQEP